MVPMTAWILLFGGGLISLIGSIWWIAECFFTAPIWGYLGLFTFPLSNLVWLAYYPRRGWKPALLTLIGTLLLGLCYYRYEPQLHDLLREAMPLMP